MSLAITRVDVASYVSALVWIYSVLILIRILLTWVPRMPENAALRTVVGFVEDITEPYLALFRRLIPPLRGGPGLIDISPIIAIFALVLIGSLVTSLIQG
ncbi:MAG: YggT family protein [Solirubrobacterales bacterium]|nr:YggT family protein [Solirubrobacterales bacterium]